MFRVIIAGSRSFADRELLFRTMDNLLSQKNEKIVILCGRARGADMLGEEYAQSKGYEIAYYPAEWDKFGLSAGFMRNVQMAENADALVAFWDGQSSGTSHMIATAKDRGLNIRIIRYQN